MVKNVEGFPYGRRAGLIAWVGSSYSSAYSSYRPFFRIFSFIRRFPLRNFSIKRTENSIATSFFSFLKRKILLEAIRLLCCAESHFTSFCWWLFFLHIFMKAEKMNDSNVLSDAPHSRHSVQGWSSKCLQAFFLSLLHQLSSLVNSSARDKWIDEKKLRNE